MTHLLSQLKLLLTLPKGNDMWFFWSYANAMKKGLIPYVNFHPEYPPFALLLFYVPYIFTNDQIFYTLIFKIIILATVLVGGYTIWIWKKDMGKVWLYLFLLFLVQSSDERFLFNRFDIFPAVFTLVSLYWFSQKKKEGLSWFVLFVATMMKVYPLILAPVLFLKSRSKWSILWFILPLVLSNLFVLYASHGTYLQFFQMQGNRPPEVGSILASCMIAWHFLTGISIPMVYAMNSWSINIPAHLLRVFMGIVITITIVPLALLRKRVLGFDLTRLAAIAISVFMLISTVFSAQFFIWLTVLIPFLDTTETLIFVSTVFLTSWVFVFWNDFWSGKPMNDFIAFILLTKNVMFYMLYLKLLWGKVRLCHFFPPFFHRGEFVSGA